MKKRGIEVKVLGIVSVIIFFGAVAAGIMADRIQKMTLQSISDAVSETSAKIILMNIEATMLEGRADIAKEAMKNIRGIKGIEDVNIYNPEGREAFKDEPQAIEPSIMEELRMGKEQVLRKDRLHLTYYLPLQNKPTCQKCHGVERPLRGAIKVSISIEKVYTRAMKITIMVVIAATVIGALLVSFLFWVFLRRMIVAPIKALGAAAERVADGDLSFNVKIDHNDELGNLSRMLKESSRTLGSVFQRIREQSGRILKVSEGVEKESETILRGAEIEAEAMANIAESVGEIDGSAAEIASSTEGLAASVEETSAAMEQMVSSINSVNHNIHELSAAVEATSSSIEELSATIREVAVSADDLATASEETLSAVSEITAAIREVEENAKESARQSEKVTNEATTFGMASIEKTIGGMRNIETSVQRTAEFIRKLGGRSDEIGKILTVIDDVTDQTTLLALNAAILAAQAGEHGKGFSVVAEEIKDLAERTAFSTQEIAALIQAVQDETKNAVDAMQAGLASVAEGFRLSKEAGDALKKIVESSRQSSDMSRSIERSTAEQAKAAKLVAGAMERVRNMIDQIAKATSEESKGIVLIIKATEKMRDVSRQVSKATEEQAISSKQISEAIETSAEKSQKISLALAEHKLNTGRISNIVLGVKGIPAENRKLAFRVNNVIRDLHKDSELLKAEVERFRFHEGRDDVLRFGVVPLESPAEVYKKFTPLADYMKRKLGRSVDLKVGVDFESAVRDIGQNVTQLCAMGPATYIDANRAYSVKVLVKALRNGKPFHHSVIITRADSPVSTLNDLRGRSFAFGDVQSSTGHIVPKVMLKEAGIELGDLSYYNFLSRHDDVAKAVLKGDFDAGGVMESTANRFLEQGLRIVQVSNDIPEFNICYHPEMDELEVGRIKTALLTLDISKEEDALILRSLGKECTGFTEASDSDYDDMRRKIAKLGAG